MLGVRILQNDINDDRPVLALIDASGFIYRAYYALPDLRRSHDGAAIGAVSGFCNMIYRFITKVNTPDGWSITHIAVVFDAAGKNFRHGIFPDYKVNRRSTPDDLISQFTKTREAVTAFGMLSIENPGFEADDIIASYTKLAISQDYRVVIISSDKDMMQLVSNNVRVWDGYKNTTIDDEGVISKFGVSPTQVTDVQALAGDSSDGIPGAPGIGIKTAADLINTYGDIETLLGRSDEVKQKKRRSVLQEYAEQIRMSYRLVTLSKDVPILYSLEDMQKRPPDISVISDYLNDMEFRSLAGRVSKHYGEQKGIDYTHKDKQEHCTRVVQRIEMDSIENIITDCYRDRIVSFMFHNKDGIEGISLAPGYNSPCYYISFKQQGDEGITAILDKLLQVFEDVSILKIGHNIQDILRALYSTGVNSMVMPFDDVMLMAHVLDSGYTVSSVDDLVEKYLDIIPYKSDDGTANEVSSECIVGCTAWEIRGLYKILKARLVKEGLISVYETLERRILPVVIEMERAGIGIDKDEMLQLTESFHIRMKSIEEIIFSEAGEEFNLFSPKQLGDVLFDRMGLPGGRRTKTGLYSTDSAVLESLKIQGYGIASRLLDWRKLMKLAAYGDSLLKSRDIGTARIHSSFNIGATVTGRIASAKPNLQNIPVRTAEGKLIRRAFIADSEYSFISCDYNQIELRILAHIANVKSLQEYFKRGDDVHVMTASKIFGIPILQVDDEYRRKAKAINFGIIYGMSAYGLAGHLGVPVSHAKEIIESYFIQFPEIRVYMNDIVDEANKTGYVHSLLGRRMYIRTRKGKVDSLHERAAINAPIQGTAADIIRVAMDRATQRLKTFGVKARMLLQIHDELLFEVHDSCVNEVVKLVVEAMENATQPFFCSAVPITIDVEVSKCWGE